MTTFKTRDDVTLFFKDWDSRTGQPVVLSHGGAPHGLTFTHRERLNADLLAFLRS